MLLVITRPDASGIEKENAADSHDTYNSPRLRRRLILKSLKDRYGDISTVEHPSSAEDDLSPYKTVHDQGLLDFLESAWENWVDLGEDGRDISACSQRIGGDIGGDDAESIPGLIPINFALPRNSRERPGNSVYGGIAYYCTDMCTPIVSSLLEELQWDGAVVKMAVERAVAAVSASTVDDSVRVGSHVPAVRAAYAITTHPGHHAARDSYGGYCYVNHAARAAREMQTLIGEGTKVAILDVDYHCGNGTAAIFYTDPNVWVCSLHCNPDFDYPFTSGFADQIGEGSGWGSTMHMPLPPKTSWQKYEEALSVAMDAITSGFGAQGLVVSLGLDTYAGDEVSTKRAGFQLSGDDYTKMGELIGSKTNVPTVFIQEGGYKMDVVGDAAADVVASFCKASKG